MPRSLTDVPGPKPLPVLGNLKPLKGDPLVFVTELSRTYGGLALFHVGPQKTLLISEPALIEQVLVKHRAVTVKDPITSELSEVLGQGLLTAEGETWRQNRRLIAPSFQPRHLAALGETMVDCADRAQAGISDGVRDAHHDMMGLTLEIAIRTIFGASPEGEVAQVGPLVEELMFGFDQQVHTWRRLLPSWVPTKFRRAVGTHRAALHVIVQDLIDRKRREGLGDDLLSRLLEARDEEGKGMDDEQLRDEMLTLFLAGHETTALALSYALLLLARHPEAQARAKAELDAVLGGALPTAGDSRRLPFVDAVFQESMRLYPPAWVIGRQATQDFLLRDPSGDAAEDVAVPAGTVMLMSPWAVHRDPRWYEAPLDFRPERWLEGRERPKFAFFPFGGGQRVCVGNHFARMEAVLVLARWLQAFEVRPVEGFELSLTASVTVRPDCGVQVEMVRRESSRAVA